MRAMARKFTRDQEREILGAYESWDPDTETIGELCEKLEISRQALYSVLSRNGVALKGREGQVVAHSDNIAKEMANQALQVLIEQLGVAKRDVIVARHEADQALSRIQQLEAKIAQLEATNPASKPGSALASSRRPGLRSRT